MRVLRQISAFFKEMSADNSYSKDYYTPELQALVSTFVPLINEENCELVANVVSFYFNVLIAKGGFSLVATSFALFDATL